MIDKQKYMNVTWSDLDNIKSISPIRDLKVVTSRQVCDYSGLEINTLAVKRQRIRKELDELGLYSDTFAGIVIKIAGIRGFNQIQKEGIRLENGAQANIPSINTCFYTAPALARLMDEIEDGWTERNILKEI